MAAQTGARWRLPTILFAIAVLVSGAVLIALSADLSFRLDDWEFLLYRRGLTADNILLPHNEHIAIAPIVIYRALVATVGMDSAHPFFAASTAVFLSSVVLLFVWLRRRLGAWLALAATIPVLFLGSGAEDLLWPFQVGYFGSVAGGLAMLLAIERRTRVGDLVACAALTASISFSTIGLAFLAAAVVALARDPRGWQRAYVVIVPAALFVVWWLGWGHKGPSSITVSNLAVAPSYMADGIASSLASLFGIVTFGFADGNDVLPVGRLLLVAGIAVAVWRLRRLGRIPDWLWAVATVGLVFWFLAALNANADRQPTASRYQYVGVVFVLLVAAELARGARLGRRGLVAVFAVVAIATAGNLVRLHSVWEGFRGDSRFVRGDLAAVEIARDTVDPNFALTQDVATTGSFGLVNAGVYLPAADADGSPAYTPEELSAAPEDVREAADRVLAAALRIAVVPGAASPGPVAPTLLSPPGGARASGRGCLRVDSGGGGAVVVELPVGGVSVDAGRTAEVHVALRRFASGAFSVDAGTVAAGQSASIPIPADRSQVPWQLAVDSTGPTTVCGLAA